MIMIISVYISFFIQMKMNFFATNEVIMMGIDSNKRKSAPFPVIIIKTLLLL